MNCPRNCDRKPLPGAGPGLYCLYWTDEGRWCAACDVVPEACWEVSLRLEAARRGLEPWEVLAEELGAGRRTEEQRRQELQRLAVAAGMTPARAAEAVGETP